ncbi:MAG: hypothetical protein ED559_00450 [Phycisphaera sp.]|nr:MAG: hypothetical protein ED559_00450 [Phycisphaera sp.]
MHRMMTMACVGVVMAGSVSAQDHFHMTVDTVPTPGLSQTVIKAGYLGNESLYSIENGRLMFDGEIAVVNLENQISGGAFDGYFGGNGIVLTSDFFFSTGRLSGGDFNYEIAEVATLVGPDARVVWVHAAGPGVFTLQADSEAASQADRSYNVGIGGHQHAQLAFIEHEGLYDIAFVGWDSNGIYLQSETVTVRFQAGEPNLCVADVNGDGTLSPTDFTAWINAYNNGDPECDQNDDGACTPADFTAWIANYNAGC